MLLFIFLYFMSMGEMRVSVPCISEWFIHFLYLFIPCLQETKHKEDRQGHTLGWVIFDEFDRSTQLALKLSTLKWWKRWRLGRNFYLERKGKPNSAISPGVLMLSAKAMNIRLWMCLLANTRRWKEPKRPKRIWHFLWFRDELLLPFNINFNFGTVHPPEILFRDKRFCMPHNNRGFNTCHRQLFKL